MSSPPPTLINTARPFGRQCLAFYNEFPSGAAGLNVTHSQLQFELGGGDVRVCGWRTVSTMFVSVVLMTDDKVNTHTHTHTHTHTRHVLWKWARTNRKEETAGNRRLRPCVWGHVVSMLSGQTKCQNKCHSVRSFWAWPFRLDGVYYSIKSHRTPPGLK